MLLNELEQFSPAHYVFDLRDQLKRHIYGRSKEAFDRGDAARDRLRTSRDLDAYRKAMRRSFVESLGGLPPSDTPLNPRVVGTIQEPGLRIEKVIFESRPKVYVTANLYVPNGITAPRGAVLFLCGHHEQAKHAGEYQIVCRYLAAAGLVVLAQDPVGQGERISYYEKTLGGTTVRWGTLEHDYTGSQCLAVGDTIARYFAHDAMRGIDYLMTRLEVDPKRIGVTGNSGGGTQTCLMMMCDSRIAAAAPATFLMNRETWQLAGGAQDAEQIWPGMTAAGWDHEDVLLMMAPRPVCVLSVTSDFFPIEGTRRTVQRCKRFWKMHGRANDLVLAEDFSTHKYTPTMARTASRFFAKHLLGKQVTLRNRDQEIQLIEPSKLWCTKSGSVRGEIAGARFVFEENADRASELQRQRRSLSAADRRRKGLTWLRERVFAHRKPCELNPRFYLDEQLEDLTVQMCFWWAQEGIFSHAYLFRDFRFTGKKLPVTVAVWDQGTRALQPHIKWLRRTARAGRAVMVLETSGVGALSPNPTTLRDPNGFLGVTHKFNDDLIWLNDSIAALRTYDVIRALDMIAVWPGLDAADIRCYAHGRQGLYGQLAAALDDRIKKIEVIDGMDSYTDWVASRYYNAYDIRSVLIQDILKHVDLPDLK